jgi:hypothetical protein
MLSTPENTTKILNFLPQSNKGVRNSLQHTNPDKQKCRNGILNANQM